MGGSKLVRYQIIAFILVTVLGITYAMTQYIGLPRLLGVGQFHVSVLMPDTGGLYTGAIVTERGVTVGKVSSVGLNGQDVTADISLNDGTRVPARGLKAAVENTSAIGEQYLELTPAQSGGPYLEAGSVIPARSVTLPPSPATLLATLNTLLESVPEKQLNVTINQLYDAFNGTGPQLRQLLTSASALLSAAQQNLTPTKDLLTQLRPVLGTQAANSGAITSFSRNLATVSGQLKASNSALAGTIDQGPGFASELNDLVRQLQPTVPLLLANLTSVSQVTDVYITGLRQVLVIFPADVDNLTATIMDSPVKGTANGDFNLETGDPLACTQGYTTPVRSPEDTSPAALPAPGQEPHCDVPTDSAQEVRGAHNDPCPNNPDLRSATAAGCGLYFGDATPETAGSGGTQASGSGGSGGIIGESAYDEDNGLFFGPNGILYQAGGTLTGGGPSTLPGLLKQTLGG
jgi:phospholipid/cholesterol/gamma-HCH transport system substrate-binding protein